MRGRCSGAGASCLHERVIYTTLLPQCTFHQQSTLSSTGWQCAPGPLSSVALPSYCIAQPASPQPANGQHTTNLCPCGHTRSTMRHLIATAAALAAVPNHTLMRDQDAAVAAAAAAAAARDVTPQCSGLVTLPHTKHTWQGTSEQTQHNHLRHGCKVDEHAWARLNCVCLEISDENKATYGTRTAHH
jgi:hypothetical protein